MARTTIIEGGTIVTHEQSFKADLIVTGERIAGLVADARGMLADERIDASGKLVMPGGIDVHTHFREPEEFTKEGFTTGSQAAAAGGITSVVEMPQADPTTVNGDQFQAKRTRVAKTSIVDMALWAGVIGEPKQNAEALKEMAAMGASAYKSFMASSSPSFPAVNVDKLHWAMQIIAETGLPYGLHAEDDVMVAAGLARMEAAGRKDPMAHAESRPPLVEAVAVANALHLAEITGCWVHICHCASADALRQIAEARAKGVRVTVETCTQYLSLNTDDLVNLKGFARCAPALRPQSEVDQIWEYVLDETIDVVCSDHCGFTKEQKEAGAEDIFRAPMGLSGVQTLLPSFFDTAVNQRGLALPQFVRQISTNPAHIFGLYPRKGTIAIGMDADVIVFDPEKEWTVTGADMLHKQKWTPWEGKTIKGRVLRTLRRGEVIYNDALEGAARIPAAPGSGRYLARGYGEKDY